MKKILISSAILTLLAGCSSAFNSGGSSDFGCPGMPMGIVCKTPAAVYKSSNGELPTTDFDTPMGSDNEKKMTKTERGVISFSGDSSTLSPSVARPLRVPAVVMRIWVSPWIDRADVWHSASYNFVETTPRKWSYGSDEKAMGGVVLPYKGVSDVDSMSKQVKYTATETQYKPTTPVQQNNNGNTGMNQSSLKNNMDLVKGMVPDTNNLGLNSFGLQSQY